MVIECITSPVTEEKDGIPPLPPGFVALKSFTLQRVQDTILVSRTANDSRKAMTDSDGSTVDVVKLRKSLRHKPWVNYCQFDNSSDEESDSELVDKDKPLILPKGVLRGCSDCGNCQKVVARWRPDGSCRPVLDEAPVFYPSEEEFKDTLKYISKIRSAAEPYGICRIVPPPSWKPSCPLKEDRFWEGSTFTTRIQRVDKLQNRETLKKISRNCSIMKKKRRKLGVDCQNESDDIAEANKTRLYSERFGFPQGPDFSLGSFQKYADHFKEQYFSSGVSSNLRSEQWEPSIENIEGEYWRIVEHPTEEIEVLYGADLDTGAFGSGFTKASPPDPDLDDQCANSGWNLNNVSRLSGSVLAFESGDISGVLVPWLYIGMCFSSFCWHVEDHHLYSLNYLHWGAPKIWYGVPGREALNLEAVMKKHLAELFEEQPNLLHNLVTQFSPSTLKLESVPVCRCVQHPGEFVLTFPRAYHTGFNCGFNCAEAVNVAPVDWLPHGQYAVELYREQMRKITISHDKLLLGAARETVRALWYILFLKKNTFENQIWKDVSGPNAVLGKSIKARVELEKLRREYLCSSQIRKMDSSFDANSERECVVCHYDLHLSAAGCPCSPDKFACLIHAANLCPCAWSTRFFLFRYEISELNMLIDAVGGKLSAVHKWGMQDLNLSLSSYYNKEKSSESRFTSHTCLEAKNVNNVSSGSQDCSSSFSKKSTSTQNVNASVLQMSSSAQSKALAVNSTSVIDNLNTCSQQLKVKVPSAYVPGLLGNSLSKVRDNHNQQTVDVCLSSDDRYSEECSRKAKCTENSASSSNSMSSSLMESEEKLRSKIKCSVFGIGKNLAASEEAVLVPVGGEQDVTLSYKGNDELTAGKGAVSVKNFNHFGTVFNSQKQQVSIPAKACAMLINERADNQNDENNIHSHGPSSSMLKGQGNKENLESHSFHVSTHVPIVSSSQSPSHHNNSENVSISQNISDILAAEEVRNCAAEHAKTEQNYQQQQQCTSLKLAQGNIAGKFSESDPSGSIMGKGGVAATCSSYPLSSIDVQNHMQRGPRMAKVVRRINCTVVPLEYGAVFSGRLWSTSQAIFPKGPSNEKIKIISSPWAPSVSESS
ncbi:putative lysine-specific demethylase JMJ14 [Apostasia shenzhenica]|uniref:Putative lysine-specific demethylase JMJ14 n=1 Tax=Apostasia shenzhenica TaxID=1088818 RepID=A0A2I0BBG2_9ASPA|nr:putative lysine-specific demethylase JMJ14 [Apostasia shenzhenica]